MASPDPQNRPFLGSMERQERQCWVARSGQERTRALFISSGAAERLRFIRKLRLEVNVAVLSLPHSPQFLLPLAQVIERGGSQEARISTFPNYRKTYSAPFLASLV